MLLLGCELGAFQKLAVAADDRQRRAKLVRKAFDRAVDPLLHDVQRRRNAAGQQRAEERRADRLPREPLHDFGRVQSVAQPYAVRKRIGDRQNGTPVPRDPTHLPDLRFRRNGFGRDPCFPSFAQCKRRAAAVVDRVTARVLFARLVRDLLKQPVDRERKRLFLAERTRFNRADRHANVRDHQTKHADEQHGCDQQNGP